ncbi:MAG: CCDC90 family protein [Betaproteobacteria bacterium]|nr:CCDC90 family protein [Betaproteobacteria bacterium]
MPSEDDDLSTSTHMSTITFDTLKYANRLKKAGFTPEQAEAHVEAQAAVLSEALEMSRQDIATKGDIAALKGDIAATKTDIAMLKGDLVQLEQRMTIKLGTMLTVAVGAMVALTKLL